MTLVHQPSMWDLAEEAALTPLSGRVVRHELSRGAWVDHLPGWITGSESVLEVLRGDIGGGGDRRGVYGAGGPGPPPARWVGGRRDFPAPGAAGGPRRAHPP